MKHKHYDMIVAWADGAQIQLKAINGWRDIQCPKWHDNNDYRIKPTRPQWQQDLIDAVKAGKVVEVNVGVWKKSLLNDDTESYKFGVAPPEQYRIKPEPKPDVVLLGAVLETGESGRFTTYASNGDSSFPDNLRLTFDGETGNLKSAEVL